MEIENRIIKVFNNFVEETSNANPVAKKQLKMLDENADLKSVKLEEIGLSSIHFIKVIVALEVEFDIEFEDEEMVSLNYRTMSDIADLIKTKIS